MPLETWSTVASVGTVVVIAATALAAIVQLRHLSTSNQLAGLRSILGRSEDPQLVEWSDTIRTALEQKLPDPAFRKSVEEGTFDRRNAPWLHLYNWYD